MTKEQLQNLTQAIYTVAFQCFDNEPSIDGMEAGRLARAIESRIEDFLSDEFEVEL